MLKFGLVIWHLVLVRSIIAQQRLNLKAKPNTATSIHLSWDSSSENHSPYHLQKAPTAYPIPPPQTTKGVSFNMENYIKYSDISWSVLNFEVELDVRTSTNHSPSPGVLFHVKSQNDDESAIIGINGFNPFLILNCNGTNRLFDMNWYNFSSNSGKWHRIRVHRHMGNISVQIQVDENLLEKGYHCNSTQANRSSKATVLIGGLPINTPLPLSLLNTTINSSKIPNGFIGCIRNATLDGQLLNSLTPSKESNLKHKSPTKSCLSNIERGMNVGANGYVKYFGMVNATRKIIHRFHFKTRRQNWILLYANTTGSFYSLRLQDGNLVYSSNTTTASLNYSKPLCDNSWYSVVLWYSNDSCHVKVNNEIFNITDHFNANGISPRGFSLYMGGFPKESSNPHSDVKSEHSFKGCLKDLSYIKNTKFIEEAVSVELSGCPLDDTVECKCSDLIYENKYIGYDSTFTDKNMAPLTENYYRVKVDKRNGQTVWSKWIKANTGEEKVCNCIDQYLLYLIIGGTFLVIVIIALVIVIVLLKRRQRMSPAMKCALEMKERRLTTGQRYIQNDRFSNSDGQQGSVDPLEQPYDVSTQPIHGNNFDDGSGGYETNNQIENAPVDQSGEAIYQNVPKTTNIPNEQIGQYEDTGEMIYQNVENEEIYQNSDVIRNSWVT